MQGLHQILFGRKLSISQLLSPSFLYARLHFALKLPVYEKHGRRKESSEDIGNTVIVGEKPF